MLYKKYFNPTLHAKFGDDRLQLEKDMAKKNDFYLSE